MWNYANDFDVFREYANIVTENKFYADITHPWNVVYISRKANQNYLNSIEDVCHKYADNIISVQTVPGVFAKLWANTAFWFAPKPWNSYVKLSVLHNKNSKGANHAF